MSTWVYVPYPHRIEDNNIFSWTRVAECESFDIGVQSQTRLFARASISLTTKESL